jgi:threonine aldolase
MECIDLRSDTVSWPTPEMREAMYTAAVGDDVYGEDPTVNQLEAEAAALLGKEAGLLLVSGSQGNLTAVLTHCGRGDEMILGRQAHIFRYEQGGAAGLGGVQSNVLDVEPDGTLKLEAVAAAIRGDGIHFPRTRLGCLENTQGTIGGIPVGAQYTAELGRLVRKHGLKLHIDGARIFNAAAALGVPARELAAPADSLMFCLSKGLCAPVGSILVGSKEFITAARRTRKVLGGGMRQAGILAAAGLVALRTMTGRLADDHRNARSLAEGLAGNPFISIDLESVRTNMVFFELAGNCPVAPEVFKSRLRDEYKVIVSPYPGYARRFRMVTHYWITQEKVKTVIGAVKAILG